MGFPIGDRFLAHGSRPFIIAEVGVNHESDLAVAETMIREAARAGADAVKFQTYKAESLAATDSPTYWDERKSQREFFRQYDLFDEPEYVHLAKVCRENGVEFLSTPFDKRAVDFLDSLMPVYKVASADITNIDLLRYIARKRKPIILSTGASALSEVARAVELLNAEGIESIALLHCVLHYPTDHSEANLKTISYLSKCFPDCIVGYSDHTKPDDTMSTCLAAALLGASIIEKHFTLDKSKPGNDHYHAMDPEDLARLSRSLDRVWAALGHEGRWAQESELAARRFARRSVVSAKPIKKGTTIQPDQLTCKRPCTGIPADQFDLVVGLSATRDIPPDTILKWSMLGGVEDEQGGRK